MCTAEYEEKREWRWKRVRTVRGESRCSLFIARRRTLWGAQAAQTTGREWIMGGFPVEDKEEAFIKEDDCEVFCFVFFCPFMYYMYRKSCSQPSIRLMKALGCLHTRLDSTLQTLRRKRRKKRGEKRKREVGAEPLTCCWNIDEVAKWCSANSHPLAFADRPSSGIFPSFSFVVFSFLSPSLIHFSSFCLLLNKYSTLIINSSYHANFWGLGSLGSEENQHCYQ